MCLMSGSARTVIGFDRRLLPFMTVYRFSTAAGVRHVDVGPPYPASLSPQIWRRPKDIDEIPLEQLNAFNLQYLPEESEEHSILVAFSVATSALDERSWGRSIVPICERFLLAERGWRVLGYDLADRSIKISALYEAYTLTPGICDAIGVGDDLLNRHGLMPTLEIAEELKLLFDKEDPDVHSPHQIVKVHAKIVTPA